MAVLALPDLGEGLQSAEIVSWHVNVGDHVVTGQPLVSVETDKAVVDVPAPHAGRIARLCAAVGEQVDVGAPLVEFSEDAAADTGTVVGNLGAVPADSPAPATSAAPDSPAKRAGKASPREGAGKATPRVRDLARKLGVALAAVNGSGPGGAILARDIEAAASENREPGAGVEPLRGVRLAMAERMARAHAQVVPAGLHDDADVHHWDADTDVTLALVRAIAQACSVEPALNCWLDMQAQTRRLHDRVDLGIAVDTPDGLFVPVLRDVAGRDVDDLESGLQHLKDAVQRRAISPDDLRGQTITLSNFGMLGGRYAELVVVPPQVAIIGAGRVEASAVAIGDGLAVRRRLPLSLCFDHRAVTGGEAARFMAALIERLENTQPSGRKPP